MPRCLGIGLNGISDYSTELPFVDAFKSSRRWFAQSSGNWDTQTQLDLDSSGWVRSLPPNQWAATLLLRDLPTYKGGKYLVTYQGSGTIEYGFDAKKLQSLSQVDMIEVSPSSAGILLKITATDPKNYIRDIAVFHESFAGFSSRFNPDFVRTIAPFGCLRFMDWMKTNGSKQVNWGDRPTLNDATWQTKGAPVEIMVTLANQTKSSAWFNIPHLASDDYVRAFATYVRDQLDPNLQVYAEYSNEVWNFGFEQSQWAIARAKALWGENPVGGAGWMQFYGMRAAQVADIWREVFGRSDRLVNVFATQAAWKGLEEPALETPAWVNMRGKRAARSFDAYAIAGYFGNSLGIQEHSAIVRSWLNGGDGGFNKAVQQLAQGGLLPTKTSQDSVPDMIGLFRYHADVCKKYNLRLTAYEGGSHVVGVGGLEGDEALTQFFIALNRRPEMKRLYKALLDGWKAAGGTLFNHFVDVATPSKWGSWGAIEYLDQKGAPKYEALVEFSAGDRWWNAPSPSPSPTPVPVPTPTPTGKDPAAVARLAAEFVARYNAL